MHIKVVLIPSFELSQQLGRIEGSLSLLHERIDTMTPAMERITREVAETKTAVQSAVTLINGLAQQIRDNADDPVALNALADDLDQSQADIAAAVTANTPAAPPDEPQAA